MREPEATQFAVERPGVLQVLESWVGGLLAVLLLVEIVVGLLLVVIDLESANFHVPRWISIPVFLLLAPVNFVMVARIWDSLTARRLPLPIAVAQRYLPMSAARRFIYGSVFGLYAVGSGIWVWMWTATVDAYAGRFGLDSALPGLLVVGSGVSFLANQTIVLLLASLTNSLDAPQWFWRRRLYWDLAIVLGVCLRAI